MLDSMVEEINSLLEDGESLDANRVKAIFYVLYFGAQQPDEVGLQSFVDCFVTYTEGIRTVIDTDQEGNEVEVEETYQIRTWWMTCPKSMSGSARRRESRPLQATRQTPTTSTT